MKGRDNMRKNKNILKYCPNFYKITNYDFDDDDHISLKLILMLMMVKMLKK